MDDVERRPFAFGAGDVAGLESRGRGAGRIAAIVSRPATVFYKFGTGFVIMEDNTESGQGRNCNGEFFFIAIPAFFICVFVRNSISMTSQKMKTRKTLPKIPAWLPDTSISVCRQYVKCGRRNCRCASGRREDRHLAHYAFWRECGHLRKHYLQPAVAHQLAELISKRRQRRRSERAERERALAQWRELRQATRHQEALLKSYK